MNAGTIAILIQKGLTAEDLLEVAQAMEASQVKKQSVGAIRQARYRERLKVPSVTNDVTSDTSRDVTKGPYDINSTPKGSSLRSVRDHAKAAFDDEFWPAYPRRSGSNPRQPAEQKFVRICETGVDPADIVAGARRYAASVAEADPKFTAQAITWLNQGRWTDDHTPVPRPTANGARAGPGTRRNTTMQAGQELFDERYSRTPGQDPFGH